LSARNTNTGIPLGGGVDIQVDAGGFVVAEAAASRRFLVPQHYLDPIPLQQVQLSRGTLTQNPGW